MAILASRLERLYEPKPWEEIVSAAHHLLQEANVPCDVVRDDTLLGRLGQYHAVVLPQVRLLNGETGQ